MIPFPTSSFSPAFGDAAIFSETSQTAEGFTQAIVEMTPESSFTLHQNPDWVEVIEVLGGALNVQLGELSFTLLPGDGATVPCGALHRYYNESKDRTVSFRCTIKPVSDAMARVVPRTLTAKAA